MHREHQFTSLPLSSNAITLLLLTPV
uniref:Uncharacterized protein n=1 Tax=Arundo donax TaxID=35708 RepID=A0A0A9HCQ9_ARUDO